MVSRPFHIVPEPSYEERLAYSQRAFAEWMKQRDTMSRTAGKPMSNPDQARRLLPAHVERMYSANQAAARLLYEKAQLAPTSIEAKAFALLEESRREFNIWLALAADQGKQEPPPAPPTPAAAIADLGTT